MQRTTVQPRHDWRHTAEQHGFVFHSPENDTYWDESACYRFTLRQIEDDLEDVAEAIEQMCLEIVDDAIKDERTMQRLAIPPAYWDYVATSWRNQEKNLYGRLDFSYDGYNPAKLYEYNADTPTALYETAIFQWVWLEQARERNIIPAASDQFNSLHERLIEAFRHFGLARPLHLACAQDSEEDWGTIEYLADCAAQGGLQTKLLRMEEIGISISDHFSDTEDQPIEALFKLYPWEWLLREDFAVHIPGSGCTFIEPAWKSVLSNKGLLALLWERFEGHPNLLPAYFEDDARAGDVGRDYVRKPIYSREGANIEFFRKGRRDRKNAPRAAGPYGAEGYIVQALHPLPDFDTQRPMCGVWIVASEPAGMCIREDSTAVTGDDARFIPHFIVD